MATLAVAPVMLQVRVSSPSPPFTSPFREPVLPALRVTVAATVSLPSPARVLRLRRPSSSPRSRRRPSRAQRGGQLVQGRRRLVGRPRLLPPDQPLGQLIVGLHGGLPDVSVPEGGAWLPSVSPASPARRRVSRPAPAARAGGPSSSATSPSAPRRPARRRPRPASTPGTTAGRTRPAGRPAVGPPPRGTR